MQVRTDFDVVIVGGGIVGLASAYKIASMRPEVKLAVLEKEDRLAAHQTGHNSGVIHSGLYYRPGSSKAETCTAGRKELIAFAKKNAIPHDICGKIIVATDERELSVMERIFQNGSANGVEGIAKIGPEEIRKIEPAATGIAGIHVPSAGIIDFTAVANKLAELIQTHGSHNRVLTAHKVIGFNKHDFYTSVVTSKSAISTRYLINCAGLQCDRVARMDGVDPGVQIVPFRGDYHDLTEAAASKVKNLVYPVPDPAFPFLGVHFTRMIAGGVECGPNAVFAFKREGYRKTDFDLRDTWDSLSHWSTWLLFLRHWRYGLGEYARSFSKQLLLRQLQRLVPSIGLEDFRPGNAGVRAQALGPKGELVDDFKIEATKHAIHVLNAPSPAATASLAIGEHIAKLAAEQFELDN
ncbi:MAG: L-2-hydroxyglutarate oxidase [Sedimentisphaerales bacterium]|nr:L-2-hydroxyglutarate oxidase [Sedimentisphaerales bacterium]